MFDVAQWIWNAKTEGTDSYAEFLISHEFVEKDSVLLRVSADSNYAVYINGCFVNSGQYADYPHYKIYDEMNVSDYIVPGTNYIAFIAWHYGVPTFGYCIQNHGLLFEVERNGEIVISSDETVQSRKSRRYISGKNEMITMQVGLNFHVDLKNSNKWMTGEDCSDFESSIVVEGMPEKLFPRETKKLIIQPRVGTNIVAQGTFAYRQEDSDFGAKMQHAALNFFRKHKMMENEDEKAVTLFHESGEGIYFIIDLQSEAAGYLDFDLEVTEDCQMEVGWGEHLADGRCRTNVGPRNFAAGVVLQKGRNSYMNPFRRLGCRYIQFFLHTRKVKIFYAGLRPTVYPLKIKEYKSGNLLRDKIYAVCQNTLIQCMHEHYEDCPWREQALYTMDSRNQMLCGYYAFSEYEFARANLLLISKSIKENGTLPICVPTDYELSIPSFTLIYVIQVAEYYRYTKDITTVKSCFDCVKKIVDSFMDRIDENGLIPNFDEKEEFWNFYEWQPGVDGHSYEGKAYDLCLNALLSLVIDYFVEISNVLGADTQSYLLKKKELNRNIVEVFYDEKDELFRTCSNRDIPYSVLANAWAYLCGAADNLQITNMLKIIADNSAETTELGVIPATLSMNTFRYEALLKENKEFYKDVILEEIDGTYFEMLMNGATSFWETAEGEKDFDEAGSLCHGWSAMPIYYYEILCNNK